MDDSKGTIIITGASQGIGASIALMASSEGYNVCVNYLHSHELAKKIVAQLTSDGGRAIAVSADVGCESDVKKLFDTTEAELGPVTALVNNAGILETQCKFLEIETARFERILKTNLIGAFLCSKEALRRMSTTNHGQGGAIVNVSSLAARTGAPFEYIDYAASKGALDTLATGLAREAAPQGVRVNTVRQGLFSPICMPKAVNQAELND